MVVCAAVLGCGTHVAASCHEPEEGVRSAADSSRPAARKVASGCGTITVLGASLGEAALVWCSEYGGSLMAVLWSASRSSFPEWTGEHVKTHGAKFQC